MEQRAHKPGSQGARWSWRGRRDPPQSLQREQTSDFRPPELGENKFPTQLVVICYSSPGNPIPPVTSVKMECPPSCQPREALGSIQGWTPRPRASCVSLSFRLVTRAWIKTKCPGPPDRCVLGPPVCSRKLKSTPAPPLPNEGLSGDLPTLSSPPW